MAELKPVCYKVLDECLEDYTHRTNEAPYEAFCSSCSYQKAQSGAVVSVITETDWFAQPAKPAKESKSKGSADSDLEADAPSVESS